jgi:hypothetical protein
MNLKEFVELINPQYIEPRGEKGDISFFASFNHISVEGVFDCECQLVSIMLRDWRQNVFYKVGSVPDRHDEILGPGRTYLDTTIESMALKIGAITQGLSYSTDVDVELDLADSEWYGLMKTAHQQNITLNQLVIQIIERHIKDVEKNS